MFPYPLGRWTSVDWMFVFHMDGELYSFHTPQGVGPLSTEVLEQRFGTVYPCFHTPQGVGPLSTLVDNKSARADDIWFPYS